MCAYYFWKSEQEMSSTDVAERYARTLVKRERASAGSNENAIRSVGEKTGLGYWTIWGLWNRRRKSADGVVGRLRAAMIHQLEAEVRHLEHEICILRQTGVDPRDPEIAAVAADLAKARQTLGLDA